ncbi:hypothetical protein WISP_42448 [Willisornis vidua]|uniref:Uncharacterized protein n=1 Tax=Willisornis vidua TaxID=1566151 RepID=A0ABQ9DJ87_9PASS|nr:hypothetical protein WISP_42448 [Willisornis vidua]
MKMRTVYTVIYSTRVTVCKLNYEKMKFHKIKPFWEEASHDGTAECHLDSPSRDASSEEYLLCAGENQPQGHNDMAPAPAQLAFDGPCGSLPAQDIL